MGYSEKSRGIAKYYCNLNVEAYSSKLTVDPLIAGIDTICLSHLYCIVILRLHDILLIFYIL